MGRKKKKYDFRSIWSSSKDKKETAKDESKGSPAKGGPHRSLDRDDFDDDYGYGGYSGYTRKDYSYSYGYEPYQRKSYGSTWNWGSYGSYGYLTEDNDDGIYVKAHESYLTPKDSDISYKLHYQEDTRQNRLLIKEMARFFYHKMIDDKEYIDEKYLPPNELSETDIQNVEAKKVYYQALWDKFIPGITPLEQAFSVFEDMQRKSGSSGSSRSMTNEQLMQNVDSIEFHEEIYGDPVFNELLDMHELGKQHKTKIFERLSMISHLGGEFRVEKNIEERLVPNSSIVVKKIMRDHSQVHNIDLYQRLMPTFNLKLLTKDLVVNACVDKTEHKQKIIILLDFSGSMNASEKQIWVLALMMDRLKYAMLEEAEIYFSYFVHRTEDLKFHHIYNRATALKFWSQFSTRPNGGDTDLGAMVNFIKNQIEVKHKLCNLDIDLSKETPEILAINDGQDSVKTREFTYKTNAVTLVDGLNTELRELCLKNKGKYVYINSKDEVTTYPK